MPGHAVHRLDRPVLEREVDAEVIDLDQALLVHNVSLSRSRAAVAGGILRMPAPDDNRYRNRIAYNSSPGPESP